MRVKIGAERRHQWKGFEEIAVAKVTKHENYEPPNDDKHDNNDIALLKLKYAYKNKGEKRYLAVNCNKSEISDCNSINDNTQQSRTVPRLIRIA